ncbi:MAG TPA: hypothetical protein PLR20_09940 [Syntrophales bacterium]|jgi:hypothetical protein|nr:hypothetical protein [Syntrophales bacterium]HOX93200.1 hypothetical protein [Syntrophales bacterium]HPI57622.1 hypothetical protein [Syntrophales bacterium]HPN25365.1 hypothetical protein [Syntrophales bacterium]HQM29657.1 hypothetical protein [Syntrophales bacterium]
MEETIAAEDATLLKDLGNGKLVIERANGEQWILDAKKSWCPWSWRHEGKKVCLRFGPWSSLLTSEEGEVCEFWTEEQIR